MKVPGNAQFRLVFEFAVAIAAWWDKRSIPPRWLHYLTFDEKATGVHFVTATVRSRALRRASVRCGSACNHVGVRP
jgi:hypothetical protein